MGFGIVLLMNFLDGSFRDPEEIESFLHLPVASTVAYFETDREKRIQSVKTVVLCLCVSVFFAANIALFWYAWNQGKIAF